ncbi:hypothetical protein ABTZ58_13265 [Streptomyces sp. NPDC094143]|uniref:hypothetical protein n=1 Tax=Streptomyces sp. NPDC094143 TaxID=3155310 RepID=UPI0033301F07
MAEATQGFPRTAPGGDELPPAFADRRRDDMAFLGEKVFLDIVEKLDVDHGRRKQCADASHQVASAVRSLRVVHRHAAIIPVMRSLVGGNCTGAYGA